MAVVTDFDRGGRVLALPLSGLITTEMRKGKEEQVIEKSLVSTSSPSFVAFAKHREKWAEQDLFSSPGPIQHWGPSSRQIPMLVALDQGYSDYRRFNLGDEKQVNLAEEGRLAAFFGLFLGRLDSPRRFQSPDARSVHENISTRVRCCLLCGFHTGNPPDFDLPESRTAAGCPWGGNSTGMYCLRSDRSPPAFRG